MMLTTFQPREFNQFLLQRQEAVRNGIGKIDVIHGRVGKPVALRFDDPGGHADDGRIRRHGS